MRNILLCSVLLVADAVQAYQEPQIPPQVVFDAHVNGVREVAFVGVGKVATIGNDGQIKLWQLGQASATMVWSRESGYNQASVGATAMGDKLFWIDPETQGFMWKQLRSELVHMMPLPVSEAPRSASISLAANKGVYAEKSGNVYIFSLDNGTVASSFPSGQGFLGAYLAPDGQDCVVARTTKMAAQGDRDWEVTLELRSASSGNLLRSFVGHEDLVNDVCFSPSKDKMFSASGTYVSWQPGVPVASPDAAVRVWNVATGQQTARIAFDAPAEALTISQDGTRLLVGTRDKVSVRAGSAPHDLAATLIGLEGRIDSVAITSDKSTIVAGSLGGKVGIWNYH